MPLYTYDCLVCKTQFNIRHSYGAKGVECTSCKSPNIKKNLSSVLRVTKKHQASEEAVGNQVNKAIEEGKQGLKDFRKDKEGRVYNKK